MNRFYLLLTCTLTFIFSHSNAQVSVCESDKFWSLCNEQGKIISAKYDTIFTLKQFKEEDEEFETVGYLGYSGGEVNYKTDSVEITFENPDNPGEYTEAWEYTQGVWLKGGSVDILNSSGSVKWKDATSVKVIEAVFRFDVGHYMGDGLRDIFEAPEYPSYKSFPILANINEPFYIQRNGRWGLGKIDGTEILPFKFDQIVREFITDDVFYYVDENGRAGLYANSGSRIVPAEYDTIITLLSHSEDYELVNPVLHLGYNDGKIRSTFEVDQKMVEDFNNPGYYVDVFDTVFNYYFSGGLVDIYNSKGQVLGKQSSGIMVNRVFEDRFTGGIIGTNYVNLFTPSKHYDYHDFPRVSSEELPVFFETDERWGSKNLNGKTIIPFNYDSIEVMQGPDNWVIVHEGQNKGLYSWDGELLLPVESDDLKVVIAGDNRRFILKVQGKDTLLLNAKLKPVTVNVIDEGDSNFINIYNVKQPFFAEWLINKGYNIHQNEELLYAAVYDGNVELVKVLIRKGAKINGSEDPDRSPLFAAVASDSPEMVKLLLDNGADISSTNSFGQSVMEFASEINVSKEVMLLLLEADME